MVCPITYGDHKETTGQKYNGPPITQGGHKEEDRKKLQDENIMVCPIPSGDHNYERDQDKFDVDQYAYLRNRNDIDAIITVVQKRLKDVIGYIEKRQALYFSIFQTHLVASVALTEIMH